MRTSRGRARTTNAATPPAAATSASPACSPPPARVRPVATFAAIRSRRERQSVSALLSRAWMVVEEDKEEEDRAVPVCIKIRLHAMGTARSRLVLRRQIRDQPVAGEELASLSE